MLNKKKFELIYVIFFLFLLYVKKIRDVGSCIFPAVVYQTFNTNTTITINKTTLNYQN